MWAAEQHYSILGTRFKVRATSTAHAAGMGHLLSPFDYGRRTGVRGRHTFSLVEGEVLTPSQPGEVVAYRDCRWLGKGAEPATPVAALIATLNRFAIEECEAFAVHSAVVALDGVAVAFPAESGDGKTTLSAACLTEGFSYGSDEALVLDLDTQHVVPYPKPLALTEWSRARLGVDGLASAFGPVQGDEGLYTAEDLGGRLMDDELHLGHVVLAEYGHEGVDLEEASGHEAMTAMLRLSFNHYKHGEGAFRLAANMANQVRSWRLRYDDPLLAAKVLRERLTA